MVKKCIRIFCMITVLLVMSVPAAMGEAAAGTYSYSERDIWCENEGQKIYGKAYIPQTSKEKLPLVIFSHELCMTHASGDGYARELAARGIAVYAFDYRGGSEQSQSDGRTTTMSVLTEVSDLEHVLASARQWSFVDPAQIVVLGGSQGGLVASLTAGRHARELRGLILLYPAYNIPDELHQHFASLKDVPEEVNYYGWVRLGRCYAEDAWNLDVYAGVENFRQPVLIVHGDADTAVPLSYAREAQRRYPDARLQVIRGAGHMFQDEQSFGEAMDAILVYLQKIGVIA